MARIRSRRRATVARGERTHTFPQGSTTDLEITLDRPMPDADYGVAGIPQMRNGAIRVVGVVEKTRTSVTVAVQNTNANNSYEATIEVVCMK